MSGARPAATRLALGAMAGAAVAVSLAYLPPLEAPFLVVKTAALELAAALGLLAFGLWLPSRPRLDAAWARLAWGVGLLLASTAASWAFAARAPEGAPLAAVALARWAALFGVACGAAVVAADPGARRTLCDAVTVAAAVVSAIGILQHLELAPIPIPVLSAPGSTFGNRNLAGEVVALAIPFGLAAATGVGGARRRRSEVVAVAVGLTLELVYLAATRARGAWLGGGAAIGAFAVLARPRPSRRVLALAGLAAVLAAVTALVPGPSNPYYVADSKRFASVVDIAEASFDPRSVALRTRLGLWRRTLAMWRDHPVLGVGPGNWPRFFPRYAEPGAADEGVLRIGLAPRQAHDDLLERAAETGALGLAALLVLGALTASVARRKLRAADRADRVVVAAGSATLIALVAVGLTGFPLEMPGTTLLAGLALGLVAGCPPSEADVEKSAAAAPAGRAWLARAAVALGAGLALVAVARGVREARGSYWLAVGERALRHDHGPAGAREALPALERARAVTPERFAAWLRSAQADLKLGRPADSEAAARRALALEPYSPNAWAALAAAQLPRDPRVARESAERALAILRDNPFALFVLAKAATAAGDAETAGRANDSLQALSDERTTDQKTAATARELLQLDGLR